RTLPILPKLPKQRLLCKENCRSAALFGRVGQLSVGWSGGWNAVRASGRLSLPKGEGRVKVYWRRPTVVGLQPLTLVLSPFAKGRGDKGHTKCAQHRFSF